MKKPVTSLYGQMFYAFFLGVNLLIIPNKILTLFSIETTQEVWIRILGLLIMAISIFYYYFANYANEKIVWGTIYARIFLCSGLITLIGFGLLYPVLIILPLVELTLTLWTYQQIKT